MVMNPLKDESIDKRSFVPCIGYFRHPFAKLTAWSFTTFQFFFVM
jgi:hypothetical protein